MSQVELDGWWTLHLGQGQGIFFLVLYSDLLLGRALYPVLWEQRILPSGKSGRSAKVTDYIYVCPSLNALNYISASPHILKVWS
jgi:hypothetical protein